MARAEETAEKLAAFMRNIERQPKGLDTSVGDPSPMVARVLENAMRKMDHDLATKESLLSEIENLKVLREMRKSVAEEVLSLQQIHAALDASSSQLPEQQQIYDALDRFFERNPEVIHRVIENSPRFVKLRDERVAAIVLDFKDQISSVQERHAKHITQLFGEVYDFFDSVFKARFQDLKLEVEDMLTSDLAERDAEYFALLEESKAFTQALGLRDEAIHETQAKLRKLQGELQSSVDGAAKSDKIVKEVESQLAKAATDNAKLSDALQIANIGWTTARLDVDRATKDLSTLRADMDTAAGDLTRANASLLATEAELVSTRTNLATSNTHLTNSQAGLAAVNTELNATKNNLITSQAELTAVYSELMATKTNLTTVQAELVAVSSELSTVKADLTTSQAKLVSVDTELTTTKTALAVLQAELTIANTESNTTKANLTASRAELTTVNIELTATKAGLDISQAKLAAANTEVTSIKAGLDASQAELAAAKTELTTVKADQVATAAKLNTTSIELDAATTELTTTTTKLLAIEVELTTARADLNTAKSEQTRLNRTIEEKEAKIQQEEKDKSEITAQLLAVKAKFESELAEKDNQIGSATEAKTQVEETYACLLEAFAYRFGLTADGRMDRELRCLAKAKKINLQCDTHSTSLSTESLFLGPVGPLLAKDENSQHLHFLLLQDALFRDPHPEVLPSTTEQGHSLPRESAIVEGLLHDMGDLSTDHGFLRAASVLYLLSRVALSVKKMPVESQVLWMDILTDLVAKVRHNRPLRRLIDRSFLLFAFWAEIQDIMARSRDVGAKRRRVTARLVNRVPNFVADRGTAAHNENILPMLSSKNSGLAQGTFLAVDMYPWVYIVTAKGTAQESIFVFHQDHLRFRQRVVPDKACVQAWLDLSSIKGLPSYMQKLDIQTESRHNIVLIGFWTAMEHSITRERETGD